LMFEDVFHALPPLLQEQRAQWQQERDPS